MQKKVTTTYISPFILLDEVCMNLLSMTRLLNIKTMVIRRTAASYVGVPLIPNAVIGSTISGETNPRIVVIAKLPRINASLGVFIRRVKVEVSSQHIEGVATYTVKPIIHKGVEEVHLASRSIEDCVAISIVTTSGGQVSYPLIVNVTVRFLTARITNTTNYTLAPTAIF